MAAVVKEGWRDELGLQIPAAVLTALLMVLFAAVLLKTPLARLGPLRSSDPSAMRLEFIPRQVPPPAQVAQPQVQPNTPRNATSAQATPQPQPATPPRAPAQAAQPAPPKTLVVTTPKAAPAPQESIANAIYTKQGQVRLPPGTVVAPPSTPEGSPPGMANARDAAKAKNVLEKPNPIHYEETRFEKDWTSSGTLGDVAAQKINGAIKDMFKSDRNSAVARPPPATRFNPALAQNQAAMGSEATGDAYKAAPIGFEKAPQPTGEASKAIHAQLDALQGRALMCKDPQKDKWLGDVRKNLTDLERNETALTHGADVQRAQYYLPQAIDASYDLSRRALWYADKRLSACGK
ncbi:hypothetical protein SAMN05428989_3033 [Pseudoxanthomonas sp. GM95]|uniref:hypothetical protein n=1 Tax=Pseudoxanthomonas sp. GM95 TaxID=1881043 RepID=UPI0008BDCDD3|nr:hypothetical protein [Pseudoxanthomonas sp. GM95]SEM09505.1 hypothetical protein SAMN05428989_3033 [Pseudoxanthomonas sp. GM95]